MCFHSDTQVTIPYVDIQSFEHNRCDQYPARKYRHGQLNNHNTQRRNNVLVSTEAAFDRLRNFNFNTLLNVEFMGETAVDNGGPRMKFVR